MKLQVHSIPLVSVRASVMNNVNCQHSFNQERSGVPLMKRKPQFTFSTIITAVFVRI